MSPDLHPAQIEAYRKMAPQEKLRAFSELYRQAWEMKVAWLTQLHRDWSEEQVIAETRKIFLNAHSG